MVHDKSGPAVDASRSTEMLEIFLGTRFPGARCDIGRGERRDSKFPKQSIENLRKSCNNVLWTTQMILQFAESITAVTRFSHLQKRATKKESWC